MNPRGLQAGGTCLIRTTAAAIGNPASWQAYDGATRYQYPSLLDPQSTSRNFNTTGTTAFIYATRLDYCAGFNRDLIRIPISITVS